MFYDPQTEDGHYCAICCREMFGRKEVCERCLSRLDEEEIEWED
jgi:uncharacterized OB-fold protein